MMTRARHVLAPEAPVFRPYIAALTPHRLPSRCHTRIACRVSSSSSSHASHLPTLGHERIHVLDRLCSVEGSPVELTWFIYMAFEAGHGGGQGHNRIERIWSFRRQGPVSSDKYSATVAPTPVHTASGQHIT